MHTSTDARGVRGSRRLAGLIVTASLLTACGTESEPVQTSSGNASPSPSVAAPTESPSPSPSSSATATPTSEPSDTPQTLMPSRGPAWPGLLSPTEVGFGTWTTSGTAPSLSARQPLCHLVDLLSIGGQKAQHRTFTSADAARDAAQNVVLFPDVKTAKRAYAVLRSWQADCAGEDGNESGNTVEAISLASPALGSAWAAYVVRSTESTELQLELREGNQASLVTVDLPAETTPAAAAKAANTMARKMAQRLVATN